MIINNKWQLADKVSLPGDKREYIVYKIAVTKSLECEYLLWDGVADYPGWVMEWQLEDFERGGLGFDKD